MEQENKSGKAPYKKAKKDQAADKPEDPNKLNRVKIDKKLKTVESNLIEEEKSDSIPVEKQLQKQFEFYFGDANLRKDKFLREKITKSEKGYVDLDVFLNFNRIKSLLQNIPDKKEQHKCLVDAINVSELLKLNKAHTKVRRVTQFSNNIDQKTQQDIDRRTIYIENFPEDSDHEIIAKIFSKCGKILHVSLPKYAESKTIKGFGFIEFSSEDETKVAIEKYNNAVPAELVEKSLFKGKTNPLKVMSKIKWLELKEEFKKIKRELVQLQAAEEASSSNQQANKKAPELHHGCLVKLKDLPAENIDKTVIKAAVASFCPPKYVDYRKGTTECIIRFENKMTTDSFLVRCQDTGFPILNKKANVELIQGQEEEAYLNRVKQYQNHLREHHASSVNQKRPRRDSYGTGNGRNQNDDEMHECFTKKKKVKCMSE